MANTGSPVVPSVDYSPRIPTPIDAASYTPPVVSHFYPKDDEDCFIYRTETVPGEACGVYNTVTLSPANQYSTEAGPEACAFPDTVYGQTANVPGLDDSLEELVPVSNAEIDNNSKYSLFHEDLVSWLQPVENDHKTSQELSHLSFHESWPSWNNSCGSKPSNWCEQAYSSVLESNFPSSIESNSGLVQRELYSYIHDDNSYFSGDNSFKGLVSSNPFMNSVSELQQDASIFSFPDKLVAENSLSGEKLSSCSSPLQQYTRQMGPFCSEPKASDIDDLYPNSEISFSEPINSLSEPRKEASIMIQSTRHKSDSFASSSIPMLSSEHSHTGGLFASSTLDQFPVSDEAACSISLFPHHQVPRAASTSSAQLFATLPEASSILWRPSLSTSSEVGRFTSHDTSKAVPSCASIPGKLLVPRSSKVIASSTVRKPSNISLLQRKPVKALDLGLVEEKNNRSIRLQSNDRTIVPSNIAEPQALKVSGHVHPNGTMGQRGDIVKSKYFISPAASSLGQEGKKVNSTPF